MKISFEQRNCVPLLWLLLLQKYLNFLFMIKSRKFIKRFAYLCTVNKFDIVVVGAGPAGMVAAGHAAAGGCSVLLLEKGEQCGKKLCITGKGKCNITNTKEWDDFSTHIYPQSLFFRPAFHHFSNKDTIAFFNQIGVETLKERGDRIFPVSQSAPMVRDALVQWATEQGVNIVTKARVTQLKVGDQQIGSVQYQRDSKTENVLCGAVVVATGGYSFPLTGSDGEGHILAQALGHQITPCFPSLTGLMPHNYDKRLQGVTLNNVGLSLVVDTEIVREEFGEIIFTDLGFEGSLGYRLSRQVVTAMRSGSKVGLTINLKAAIPSQQLQERFRRDLLRLPSETTEQFMRHYLPRELLHPFLGAAGVHLGKQIGALTPVEKERLLHQLQHWEFSIERYAGYDRAIATAGGVSLKEIQKKEMRSKIVRNLFFAGEVVDLDGDTGGYNLQIAFSTGVLAGQGAARLLNSKT